MARRVSKRMCAVFAALVAAALASCAHETPTAPPPSMVAAPASAAPSPPSPHTPPADAPLLTLGKPIQRDIHKGETHHYSVPVEPGQYVDGTVEQKGVDVIVSVFDAAGNELREVDSPNGTQGPEPFRIHSEHGGMYRVDVSPVVPPGDPGYDAFAGKGVGAYEARIDAVLSAKEGAERFAKGTLSSPRLFELWKALRDGGAAEEQRFWREYQGHAPLVEPIPDDPDHDVRVSFLWRGDRSTPWVSVFGGPVGKDEAPLEKLGDSDIRYLTVRVPHDVRFSYAFFASDEPPPSPLDPPPGPPPMRAWHSDPANPNHSGPFSAVELPDAPKGLLYGQPGVAKGQLHTEKLHSEALKEDREVKVYVPPGAEGKGPWALLLAFDSEVYGGGGPSGAGPTFIPLPAIVDALMERKELPPTVVALVPNLPDRRMKDLGLSAPFADFLAKELLPFLQKKYGVDRRPERVTVTGSSLGGLASAFLAFEHPEAVGNVLSQSGSFWFYPDATPWEKRGVEPGTFIREVAAAPKKAVVFYMEAGIFEHELRDSNRRLRDVLVAKGYPVTYREFAGGHDYACWKESIADGLRSLAASRAPAAKTSAHH